MSVTQWEYVEKLQRPAPEKVEVDASAIHAMFNGAADKLKYPRIKLVVDDNSLQLSRAGETARFPGSINVTDGGPYGNNVWYGRVVDGEWQPSRRCEDWLTNWLIRFAANPAKVAKEYGSMSGFCCFCNKPLTDDRSVTEGYGPVCAKSWDLPWGGN